MGRMDPRFVEKIALVTMDPRAKTLPDGCYQIVHVVDCYEAMRRLTA